MSEIIALVGKEGLPLLPNPEKKLRLFQPTAAIHFHRYIKGVNGNAPAIQRDSTIILDARIFEGGGDTIPKMRDYIRAIREECSNDPHILCLRFDTHNDSIARNDIKAGATATLFYMGNISDATRRMNTFIETGKLPLPRQGRTVTMANIPSLFPYGTDASDEGDGTDTTDRSMSRKPLSKAPPENRAVRATDSITKPKMTRVLRPKESMAIIPPVTPIPTTENEPGEENMKELLTALETLIGQNTQILGALEKIQGGISGLRADRETELLVQIREKFSTAMNTAFAQLQQGKTAPSTIESASVDSIVTPAPSVTPSPEAEEVSASAPKKTSLIAIATKGEPFMTNVSLFGKTIPLRHHSASLFIHFVNTGETLGSADVASMHDIGYQGGYSRIRNLIDDLDAFRKGLSSCLLLVQAGNSKNYRFDIESFRKAFGINSIK